MRIVFVLSSGAPPHSLSLVFFKLRKADLASLASMDRALLLVSCYNTLSHMLFTRIEQDKIKWTVSQDFGPEVFLFKQLLLAVLQE